MPPAPRSNPDVERIDEAKRFNIWTGLAAHRPVGNTDRAGFNTCPIHEPHA